MGAQVVDEEDFGEEFGGEGDGGVVGFGVEVLGEAEVFSGGGEVELLVGRAGGIGQGADAGRG